MREMRVALVVAGAVVVMAAFSSAAFGGEPGEGSAWDAIYQWIVLKTFHPVEAEIVAIALAFFPYRLLRGPIARIARWRLDTAL
jgi:type IV secretory pathway VirB2 component (pilin)